MQPPTDAALNAGSASELATKASPDYRADLIWIVALAALVLLVYSPLLLRIVTASPFVPSSQLVLPIKAAFFLGSPTLEPCSALLNFPLGRRAALDWLSGSVPWWNPYQGVGMPLAADMQSSALFLPFVLLYKFDWGQTACFAILQFISGASTYYLARRLGISRLAAFTAGALFELNGMFVLFRTAILSATAFFPLLLIAVENAREASLRGRSGGWSLIAISLALALYAGYPESVYIHGLFVAAWSIVRWWQLPSTSRLPFCRSLFNGLATALLLSAPIVVPFLQYLKLGYVSIHAGSIMGQLQLHMIPQLFFPYMYGPIWANLFTTVPDAWSAMGSYFGAVPLFFTALGVWGRRERGIRLMLCLWIVCSFCKAFELPPVANLFNLLPLMKITLYGRYHYPTVQMAICLLVAFSMDGLVEGVVRRRNTMILGAITALSLALSILLSGDWWKTVSSNPALHAWPFISIAAGLLLSIAAIVVALTVRCPRWKLGLVSFLLVFESTCLFVAPTLCRPRAVHIEKGGVNFLKQHLGLQRFYTLGPIEPNFGACFGIASINNNDLPVPSTWVDFVDRKLLPMPRNKAFFVGISAGNGITAQVALDQLKQGLVNYKWLGVKYIVVPAGLDCFLKHSSQSRLVFHDWLTDVYEVDGALDYFTAADGCRLQPISRTRLAAFSQASAILVRRELYFPGWSASVNGISVPIREYGGLLQSITIPPGSSEIRFDYAPPYLSYCLFALALGVSLLIISMVRRCESAK